jgi:hypothetical protein
MRRGRERRRRITAFGYFNAVSYLLNKLIITYIL